MMKDFLIYADHILEAISQIEEYAARCDRETFPKEKMRYDAILRNLQTMAESTQRLPEYLKQCYPHIPWNDISGFRNVLVHDYLGGFDDDVIWSIIENDLSPLKKATKEILYQHEK
jgi:uncharacterized protein with HEPN domain